MESAALRFYEFGNPAEVLRLEKLPVPKPGPGQLLLRLLASPINPSDLGTLNGSYGKLPELPAVAGREGCGEVVDQGSNTDGFSTGQKVLFPEDPGAWQEYRLVDAETVLPLPKEIPPAQAAMAFINPPTAWLMLEKFVQLEPGDWVLQDAANSAVGHYVIQLCRMRGIRTINLVRRPEWIEPLRKIGADVVLLADDPDLTERVQELTRDRPPQLALNSVGGPSAISLVKSLGTGGTLVTYGGMTGEPIRFPTRYLIFHDIRMVGFWLHGWKLRTAPEIKRKLMEKIFDLIAQGILFAPVEKMFPLDQFAEAIQRSSESGRSGKILFAGSKMLAEKP